MSTLHVRLLGHFSVTYGDQVVSTLTHARLQELLAYLVLKCRAPRSRQHLAYLFWPESTDTQARTNLRTLLYRLRKALPDADRFIISDTHAVQWQPSTPFVLDVTDFEEHLEKAETIEGAQQLHHMQQAVALYQGDLLPDCYGDWLLTERERLRHACTHALEHLVRAHEVRREYPLAIRYAEQLVQHDPVHEVGYQHLMQLHVANNDRARALRVYHACTTTLQNELGVNPGAATCEMYTQLLGMEDSTEPQVTPLQGTLIGRHDAWHSLMTCWRSLLSGRRPVHFVCIAGVAGIGKTRLAEEFVEWVRRQRATVAVARCFPTTRELAFAPVAAWLRACSFVELPDVWRREVARLRPEIRGSEADARPLERLREPWQQTRFFEALARAILAQRQPIVLFLDDIQWCDEETVAWLEYVCGFDKKAQLLVIATCRSEAVENDHNEARFLAGSAQRLDVVLERLNAADTARLAAEIAGHEISASLAATIYRHTEGNPLFVVELMRAGVERRDDASAPLTEKVQSTLRWRLGQLSSEARALVELAAVTGREFTYDVLVAASDLNERQVVHCLDECWRRHVIREHGTDAYDFSHDKLRETAYAELSHTRRRWLHRRVAEALQSVYASDLESISGDLGRHFAAAGRPEEAVLYYQRAARVAYTLYALEEASSYLQRAADLLPEASLPPQAAAALYEQLGEVLDLTGEHVAARRAFRNAIDCLPASAICKRARIQRLIGDSWVRQDRFDEALAAHEAALDILRDEPPGDTAEWWCERIEVGLAQANSLYFTDQLAEMQRVCDELLEPVESFGSSKQQADFCSTVIQLNNRRLRFGPSAASVKYARRALRMAQQLDDARMINRKTFSLGFQLLWYGELDAAISHLTDALSQADEAGYVYLQAQCLAYLSIAFRLRGNEHTVRAFATRGLDVAIREHNPIYIGVAKANLAWLAYRGGETEGAISHAEDALARWQGAMYPMHWLARWPLLAVALDRDDVGTAVVQAADMLDERQQVLPDPMRAAMESALSAFQANNLSTVTAHLRDALRLARETGHL